MSASFSILTPALNPGPLLRCCSQSVADQVTGNLQVTHHIHDGGSTDGSLTGLNQWPGLRVVSQPDRGMYDALNQAWAQASGDYVGFLNADEQYLPDALVRVADVFTRCPEIDVLYAGFIVIDGQWQPRCYRRPLIPSRLFVALDHLPVFTCATFVRRSSFGNWPALFDVHYRAAADADWFIRMHQAKKRMGIMDEFTSVFMLDGRNLSLRPEHAKECREIAERYASSWFWIKKIIKKVHHIRKKYHGHYANITITTAVYPLKRDQRTQITRSLDGHWPTV